MLRLRYLDARRWRREDQLNAEELQRELGLLTNLSKTAFHDEEFPTEENYRNQVKAKTPKKLSNRSRRRRELRERRGAHKGSRRVKATKGL
jgi:hypothetical protein